MSDYVDCMFLVFVCLGVLCLFFEIRSHYVAVMANLGCQLDYNCNQLNPSSWEQEERIFLTGSFEIMALI